MIRCLRLPAGVKRLPPPCQGRAAGAQPCPSLERAVSRRDPARHWPGPLILVISRVERARPMVGLMCSARVHNCVCTIPCRASVCCLQLLAEFRDCRRLAGVVHTRSTCAPSWPPSVRAVCRRASSLDHSSESVLSGSRACGPACWSGLPALPESTIVCAPFRAEL